MRVGRGPISIFLIIVGAIIFATGILDASAFWVVIGILFVVIALLI